MLVELISLTVVLYRTSLGGIFPQGDEHTAFIPNTHTHLHWACNNTQSERKIIESGMRQTKKNAKGSFEQSRVLEKWNKRNAGLSPLHPGKWCWSSLWVQRNTAGMPRQVFCWLGALTGGAQICKAARCKHLFIIYHIQWRCGLNHQMLLLFTQKMQIIVFKCAIYLIIHIGVIRVKSIKSSICSHKICKGLVSSVPFVLQGVLIMWRTRMFAGRVTYTCWPPIFKDKDVKMAFSLGWLSVGPCSTSAVPSTRIVPFNFKPEEMKISKSQDGSEAFGISSAFAIYHSVDAPWSMLQLQSPEKMELENTPSIDLLWWTQKRQMYKRMRRI